MLRQSFQLLKQQRPFSLTGWNHNRNYETSTRKKNRGNATEVINFDEEVRKFLKSVVVALEPVKNQNPNFTVVLTDTSLSINTSRGSYDLRPDPAKKQLIFKSYFSGFNAYNFDPEQRLWLGEYDNHDLRGLITRDLLRHWKGMPNF